MNSPSEQEPTPITKLPDGSGCFTATVMSREEAMALPVNERPLCFRISSEIYHAVFEAIGAASMCWNPSPSDEVFNSTEAEKVAVDLCFKIAKDQERELSRLRAELALRDAREAELRKERDALRNQLAAVEKERDETLKFNEQFSYDNLVASLTALQVAGMGQSGPNTLLAMVKECVARLVSAEAEVEKMREALLLAANLPTDQLAAPEQLRVVLRKKNLQLTKIQNEKPTVNPRC